MGSVYQNASVVGGYANRKILRFQKQYLSKGREASKGRATLARLRRLGLEGGSWLAVGGELFADLPDFALDPREEERVLNAVMATFRLYAQHQQSESDPMAFRRCEDEPQEAAARRSFGWSCWCAGFAASKRGQDKDPGIKRRLASLESVVNFGGIETQLRGLMSIVKGEGVPVDYCLLARDLYLMQVPSCRSDVFQRWARDYYLPYIDKKSQEEPAGGSDN